MDSNETKETEQKVVVSEKVDEKNDEIKQSIENELTSQQEDKNTSTSSNKLVENSEAHQIVEGKLESEMANGKTACMLASAPNWYCSTISDCNSNGLLAYGSKNNVMLLRSLDGSFVSILNGSKLLFLVFNISEFKKNLFIQI